jgi:hypothetical protein
LLPIDSPFRLAAQQRGRSFPEQQPAFDAVSLSKEAADALHVFELDTYAVISLATEVLGGERRSNPVPRSLLPVDPPDDTFSVPEWNAGRSGAAATA